VAQAARELHRARHRLAEALSGRYRLAGAGVHPFAAPHGVLNSSPRYDETAREYGGLARRQLVFGLHVHVGVRGADRALAIHDALRGHLPELAALAANAPFHDGADTGLASVRPQISGLLPRQGVPPALGDWDAYADAMRWGAAAGPVPEPRLWWWELRLHPAYGTVELRVPDAQATVAEAAALAAVAHCLVARLAARHDAGEALRAPATWRIAENRWAACRHGLDAQLADLETGRPAPARERIAALLDDLAPTAATLGCERELARARAMLDPGAAAERRSVAGRVGLRGLTAWLADRLLAPASDAGVTGLV
jgi:carboxylate-amine ligase